MDDSVIQDHPILALRKFFRKKIFAKFPCIDMKHVRNSACFVQVHRANSIDFLRYSRRSNAKLCCDILLCDMHLAHPDLNLLCVWHYIHLLSNLALRKFDIKLPQQKNFVNSVMQIFYSAMLHCANFCGIIALLEVILIFTNADIGARIHDTRIRCDLTLGEVASRIGVAESTVQRYEKGTIAKIKLPIIQSIAKVLQVDPNWLIGNVDDPRPASAPSPALTASEAQLLSDYRELNTEGQEKVSEYAADLVASGRYQKARIASAG